MNFQFKKSHESAKMPIRSTNEAACYDVFALEDMVLKTGVNKLDTGLVVDYIPPGWEIQVRSRSGLASKGVTVANAPGTIDSDYRDAVHVLLFKHEYADVLSIKAGDRIAQLAFREVPTVGVWDSTGKYPVLVPQPDVQRKGGFGSTGR